MKTVMIGTILLVAALLQEVAVGANLVVPLVVGLALAVEAKQAMRWGFGGGLIIDLVRGGKWGYEAMVLLLVATIVVIIKQLLPRRKFLVMTGFTLLAIYTESILMGRGWNRLDYLISMVIFWMSLPLFSGAGEENSSIKLKLEG